MGPGDMNAVPHVVIVGGGPAGLSAAHAIRAAGTGQVTVIERERQAGGIPRHTDHLGYGVRDLHRLMRGPAYAKRLLARAIASGVDVRCAESVLDIDGDADGNLGVVLATGERIAADAIVLATGVRERPRSARLVAGDRPAGVFTTSTVQQLTALQGKNVGTRAVIVGAEHVSFSAIWSLRHGGCTPVAMITDQPRHQTFAPLRIATASRHRVPIITDRRVVEIVGRRRVTGVTLDDGSVIDCDTVVFTGDWIPDHELARRASISIVTGSGASGTDGWFRTPQPGIFAIGNLVHPAETADVCALDGRAVSSAVDQWVTGDSWPTSIEPIAVGAPIRWAAHSSRGVTMRVDRFASGRVRLRDGDRIIATSRTRQFVPNRSITIRVQPGAAVTAVEIVEPTAHR
jgi:thioredoxin reductase